MSKGVNKVILIGNAGSDPEVRRATNGNAISSLSIATSERWRDKNSGEPQERTEWHRVVFFGRIAEVVGDYVRKGSKLYVEGKLQTRKWTGQDGQDRYTTEVVVDVGGSMQLLDSRGDRSASAQGSSNQYQSDPPPMRNNAPSANSRQAPSSPPSPAPDSGGFEDDDIPF